MTPMEVVSITVGVVSIVLAAVAIGITLTIHMRTKDVLSEIDKQTAVIKTTVDQTQTKLVDTVTSIANPQNRDTETAALEALLPAITENPEILERLITAGNDKTKQS